MDPTLLIPVVQSLLGPLIRTEVEAAVEAALVEALPSVVREAAAPQNYTRAEAARELRLSLRALDYRLQNRQIRYSKVNGRVVIPADAVREYVRRGTVPAKTDRS